MYVVIIGTLGSGGTIVGPFATRATATRYAAGYNAAVVRLALP